jgi:hypothetical protein
VGSLIGKTTEVDMAYTRKHGVVRMHVQVTSLDQIPTSTDHMYDGEGFGITFEIEGYNRPIEIEGVQGARDSNADDKPQEEGSKKADLPRANVAKEKEVRTPKTSLGSNPKSGVNEVQSVQVGSFMISPNKAQLVTESTCKPTSVSLSWGDRAEREEDLPSPLAFSAPARFDVSKVKLGKIDGHTSLVSEVEGFFNVAERPQSPPVETQREELSDQNTAENQFLPVAAEILSKTAVTAAISDGDFSISVAENVGGFPISPEGLSEHDAQQTVDHVSSRSASPSAWQEAMVHSVISSPSVSMSHSPGGKSLNRSSSPSTPRGTGAFLGGRYSQAEVLAFGGVPAAGIRSSERIKKQPNAEATQLERAQGLALQRDQAMASGISSAFKFSLASFSNDSIVSRVAKLGVKLGESPRQIQESVNNLKDTDLQRTLVMLKRNEDKIKNGQDSISESVLQDAIDLSADLNEEEQQGSFGHEDQDLLSPKQKRRGKKIVTENTVIR